MFILLAATALALQDTDLRGDPGPDEADQEATLQETPAAPTDAATLIAQFERDWTAWNGLIGEIAARKAQERYFAELLLPAISRQDLDDGARGELLSATHSAMRQLEDRNTRWAGEQIEPETFADFHAAQPRAAADLIRMAERGEAAQGRIVAALEPVALAGDYDGARFADMADSLAMAENRPQPYGTALSCVDGAWEAWPVAEQETIDERRARLGLGDWASAHAAALAGAGDSCDEEGTE